MSDLVIRAGSLSGVAHPSAYMRRMLSLANEGKMPPTSIDKIADDAVAVDALAGVITRAIEESQTADGRVDMRDVAARVIRVMQENQR